MNPLIQLKTTAPLLIALALLGFALSPKTQAVVPAPDGGYGPPAYGVGNTAEGQSALFSLTSGTYNTAVGWLSLIFVDTGKFNTAVGAGTLNVNTADGNTATGAGALVSNFEGNDNTANGAFALYYNSTSGQNTAIGHTALANNTTGSQNTALGQGAGFNQTTGSGNVYIGAGMLGVAGESNACYIKSIFSQTSANGIPVLINSNNKLGTTTSSKRFKEDIKSMDTASEALFSLKPVTFRYKKEIDAAGTSQFGLVAEEVEKVNADLVVRDKEGKPYSVRYDQVNAMLLNEFLKEHHTVQELKSAAAKQEATIARQQKQIDALSAAVQKVSAQLDLSKPAPQTVLNNQ
jgi:Chaperone of endosialidase